MRWFRRLLRDESAATMTEYAVIVALLTGACMVVLIAIANTANSSLSTVATKTQAYEVGSPP